MEFHSQHTGDSTVLLKDTKIRQMVLNGKYTWSQL